MLKLLISGALIAHFAAAVCLAQTNTSQIITNWGVAVSNVQLAITLSNTIITSGSNVTVVAWIRNTSTNTVAIFETGQPIYDFDVWLIDGSGKEHIVKPNDPIQIVNHNGPPSIIGPGSTNRFEIPIFSWYRGLKPGRYTLKVEITCFGFINEKISRDPKLRLVSNLLETQINDATAYDPIKDPMLDAEAKAMIDKWPKGAPTNGLYCAVQIIRPKVEKDMQPICAVNVVNTTTNLYRTILGLPRDAYMQIELLDLQGKPVEKTPAGKLFKVWTQKQMDIWTRKQLKARTRIYCPLLGMDYTQVNSFGIPEVFQLKQPGEYTLHLRMELAEAKWKNHDTFDRVQTTWLPEVVAKIHVGAEDIPPANPSTVTTNAPAK